MRPRRRPRGAGHRRPRAGPVPAGARWVTAPAWTRRSAATTSSGSARSRGRSKARPSPSATCWRPRRSPHTRGHGRRARPRRGARAAQPRRRALAHPARRLRDRVQPDPGRAPRRRGGRDASRRSPRPAAAASSPRHAGDARRCAGGSRSSAARSPTRVPISKRCWSSAPTSSPSVTVEPSAATMLAAVVAELGELDRADELLAVHGLDRRAARAPGHEPRAVLPQPRAGGAGPPDEALADALAVGRRYGRLGCAGPSRPGAHRRRSCSETATRTRALVQEELELAERWGTPLARGLALRGAGLVTGDAGRSRAPSRRSTVPRTGSSWPGRGSTTARRCAARAAAPRRASRCGWAWTARTPAGRARSPSVPAPSCWPRARVRAGSRSRALTR